MPAVLRENIQLLNSNRFASERFTEKHLTKSTARAKRLAWIIASTRNAGSSTVVQALGINDYAFA